MQGISANIELNAASNSDSQTKSSNLPGSAVAAVFNPRSASQTPTPRPSIDIESAVHVELGKQLLNKQQLLQQHHQHQSSVQNLMSDNEEDYTHVPSRHDRKAAEVIGKLRGACTVELSSSSSVHNMESDSNGARIPNLEYRSLDPDAMDPTHTYDAMQSTTADKGPQPMYSDPVGVHANSTTILTRPTAPLKIPPQARADNLNGPRSAAVHMPLQSVPSVDGEYVNPNDQDSHQYQGLTPSKREYLALYMTPTDSTTH